MLSSYQQEFTDAGSNAKPRMLKKGSYVPLASRFMRFIDGKKEKGILLRDSIENRPFEMKEIPDVTSPTDAPRIPNYIYNSVDAYKDPKAMRNHVKRLMQGTDLSEQERHPRLMNEFDKFSVEARESLESVYEIFSRIMNNMQRNKLLPGSIAVNTKFLNSLQPKLSKYVTMAPARNHDPFALVANIHASPSYCQPSQSYYVTHPPSVHDYKDDYQGEVQGDDQEDKLSTTMMFLA
ncbi:hypothetical protein Tco_0145341 [Tanacetum coccineum]